MMKLFADLHIHSCLSPCGAEDMTPNNIVNMAALAGYDVIAVADHNTTRNCAAAMAAGEKAGVLVVPAMELTTAEEVHTLVYLPDLDAADRLTAMVYDALPSRNNRPAIFGNQTVLDENDRFVQEDCHLLSAATSIGIYKIAAIADSLGGIAIPAHIDRASFSLLANLGFVDPSMGFTTLEVTRDCDLSALKKSRNLHGYGFISGSDAHDLFAIPDREFTIEVEAPTIQSVLKSLATPGAFERVI